MAKKEKEGDESEESRKGDDWLGRGEERMGERRGGERRREIGLKWVGVLREKSTLCNNFRQKRGVDLFSRGRPIFGDYIIIIIASSIDIIIHNRYNHS